jgi:hypothetical protein
MKKLISIFSVIAFLMFSAQAGKVSVPFTVTASGTNEATVAIAWVASTETNWVGLAGMLVTVPTNCVAAFRLYCDIGGDSVDFMSTTFVNASTNSESLKLYMPRKAVWGSSNPNVDVYPLLGTNCFVAVKQTVFSTNVWAFKVLIED